MWFKRRRSDRPELARHRPGSGLETLESRELLSTSTTAHPFFPYLPSDLPVTSAPNGQPISLSIASSGMIQQARQNPQAPLINFEGKIVSGKDRAGDEWTITVHGPGTVLVTDITPNDGILDDNLDTIQLLGTSPNDTYVTGEVRSSAYTPTNGTVFFNRLIDTNGVKSVILNGFTLTETQPPLSGGPPNSSTGIYLLGGVGTLQFHNILTTVDQSTNGQPINLVIGDPSTPLKVAPRIKLDNIFDTVLNSASTTPLTAPQTGPAVNILVNGQLRSLDIISTSDHPAVDPTQTINATTPTFGNQTLSQIPSAGDAEANYGTVGSTGRTAVRAIGINKLTVRGSATNFTASRGATPFQNGFSGLDHLRRATFGGNADAVGLDVSGPIHGLRFSRGLGNPAGSSVSSSTFGTPTVQTGYPAAGLVGGLVTSSKINHVKVLPANVNQQQTATNPDFVQLNTQGTPTVFPRVGNALTSSAIVSSGSIGKTTVVGHTVNSEIKSGFHYPSFVAGLEGTRAPSKIGPLVHKGSLINGDISATYRPSNHVYGTATDTAGPGKIHGKSSASLYVTGGTTPLNNMGAGFYARSKRGGYLPPPSLGTRVHGIQVLPR